MAFSGQFEKIVLVTRSTRLQELKARFNTVRQAEFYVAQQIENYSISKKQAAPAAARSEGRLAFKDYKTEEETYQSAIETLTRRLESLGLEVQIIDRSLVPTFLFTEHDIVMTLGQDGLVANCAKYAGDQPIVGVNPDPSRFDGVLLPFRPEQAPAAVSALLNGQAPIRQVTLAEVTLNDGQRLLAFNDLFIGPQSHVSARYKIIFNGQTEVQSSSGLIVSTGAGATGWLSSIFNMAAGVAGYTGGRLGAKPKMGWEERRLLFVVREPFASRSSQARLVAGEIDENQELELESLMPTNGVIFSDGIESDFLAFNSGALASVHPARQHARLVTR